LLSGVLSTGSAPPMRKWTRSAFAPLLDLANAPEQIRFEVGELVVGNLAHLPAHLRLEQLLAHAVSSFISASG
jgi:hypothetical protein